MERGSLVLEACTNPNKSTFAPWPVDAPNWPTVGEEVYYGSDAAEMQLGMVYHVTNTEVRLYSRTSAGPIRPIDRYAYEGPPIVCSRRSLKGPLLDHVTEQGTKTFEFGGITLF